MILLEDNLIYVATPKTASQSIKRGIVEAGIKYTSYLDNQSEVDHYHITLSEMLSKWGKKESFCIERDWFERWYSGFSYLMLGYLVAPHIETTFRLEDIDNDFIYSSFDTHFSNTLYTTDREDWRELQRRFVKNIEDIEYPSAIKVLCPANFWKSNKKCTYEFKITELDKLEDFLGTRFGKKVMFPYVNVTNSKNALPNVVVNSELKSFVYEIFEKSKSGSII